MFVGVVLIGLDGFFRVGNLLFEIVGFFVIVFDFDGVLVQNVLIFDRLQVLLSVLGCICNIVLSFIVDVVVFLQFIMVYLVGVLVFLVSFGVLFDGVVFSFLGLLFGILIIDGEVYLFIIIVIGFIYGMVLVIWFGEVVGGIGYLNMFNGCIGLNNVWFGQVDDSNIVLLVLLFQFLLFGLMFQNNIYISFNSYVDFGFGLSVYFGLLFINLGWVLFINVVDWFYQNVFVGFVLFGVCFLI